MRCVTLCLALLSRERQTPMCKIMQYPQQVRVARFSSTHPQSDLHRHSTLIGKVHHPFSNQSSHFLPQPASFMCSSAFLSSFDPQPQILMPNERHDRPHSLTHDHTNEHCFP